MAWRKFPGLGLFFGDSWVHFQVIPSKNLRILIVQTYLLDWLDYKHGLKRSESQNFLILYNMFV